MAASCRTKMVLGTAVSSVIFSRELPITLLVFSEMLHEGSAGPVLLGHFQGNLAKGVVFCDTALRRGRFPRDRRGVLGDLDQFGSNDGIEPDKIGQHLCVFGSVGILHDQVVSIFRHIKDRER